MGHAELACHGFARRVQVDANDFVCPDHFGALNHVQANATQAKDHQVGPGFDFGGKDDGTYACGDAAAYVANFVKRRI